MKYLSIFARQAAVVSLFAVSTEAFAQNCGTVPTPNSSAVGAFLDARCYKSWTHDNAVRDTGPFIDGSHLGLPFNLDFGVHPAVRIFYSPNVAAWMRAGRVGELPEPAMIVKEMFYPPPAQQYQGMSNQAIDCAVSSFTAMVKDKANSADGWYWAYRAAKQQPGCTSPPRPDLSVHATITKTKTTLLSTPSTFDYPDAGAGLYCTRCHSSAITEQTFSTIRNVDGTPETYLTIPPFSAPQAPSNPPVFTFPKPSAIANALFEQFFGATPSQSTLKSFPPETYDHVLSNPKPGGPLQLATSDQCIGCHDATAGDVWNPNMIHKDDAGRKINLSQYAEWRASMMGLAGRDPVFHAQLETENTLHQNFLAKNGDKDFFNTRCLHCHGALGQRQFAADNNGKSFSHDQVYQFSSDFDLNNSIPYKYGALARDGISCSVCHRMKLPNPKGPLDPSLYTGNFDLGSPQELYGPYQDGMLEPMQNAVGLTVKYADTIKSASLCGTCHAISLPVLDGSGNEVLDKDGKPKAIFEQATYLEWLNSAYQNEIGTPGPDAKTCQGCHMPQDYKGNQLAFRIANIEDGTYPSTDNRRITVTAGDKPVPFLLPERKEFPRHMLVGLNQFSMQMFQQFSDVLGVRQIDPMAPADTIPGMLTAAEASSDLAANATADIQITGASVKNGALVASVEVINKAGHKLPSGVGFRRVWIEFLALGSDGKPVWSSGQSNDVGVLLDGGTGQTLATEFFSASQQVFQPHYQTITRQDQVQIYEILEKNPEGFLTTSFVSLDSKAKDNRLLARGWKPNGPDGEETGPHGDAASDPQYLNGSGTDRIDYAIPCNQETAKATSLVARLHYQSLAPYFLKQRFETANGPETQRLQYMAAHLNTQDTNLRGWKLSLASTSMQIAPGKGCVVVGGSHPQHPRAAASGPKDAITDLR